MSVWQLTAGEWPRLCRRLSTREYEDARRQAQLKIAQVTEQEALDKQSATEYLPAALSHVVTYRRQH